MFSREQHRFDAPVLKRTRRSRGPFRTASRRAPAAPSDWCTRAKPPSSVRPLNQAAHAPIARASGLLVLTLERDHIAAIIASGGGGVLPHFGLPRTLPW